MTITDTIFFYFQDLQFKYESTESELLRYAWQIIEKNHILLKSAKGNKKSTNSPLNKRISLQSVLLRFRNI